jgi:putative inorganic carbon (HCO3(-)) transporter
MAPIRDIIILSLIAVTLPLCFFRPFFGVIMWVVTGIINPYSMSWGIGRQVPTGLLVAILTFAGFLLFSRECSNLASREMALLAILWGWFTFTSVYNTNLPEFAHFANDTWTKWQFVSKILVMTFVTVALVNTWERLRVLLLALAGSFAFFVFKSIPWMILTRGSERFYGPKTTYLADNNGLGLALNMVLPVMFFLAITEENRRVRWILGSAFSLTIIAVLLTYSRGALVGLVAVVLFLLLRSRNRLILIPALVCAGFISLAFLPDKWQHRMDFTQTNAVLDDSALSRINAWTYSWRLAMDYPVTGGGFEAFTPALFTRYAPNPRDVHGPHSIYFGVLAEHGFVGLFLYLSLIASCFATLHRIRKAALAAEDERAASYAVMLQLSIVGFLTSGAFLGFAYFDCFFTIVACTAILKKVSINESVAELEDEPLVYEEQAI